jgi:hypothetical protein
MIMHSQLFDRFNAHVHPQRSESVSGVEPSKLPYIAQNRPRLRKAFGPDIKHWQRFEGERPGCAFGTKILEWESEVFICL